MEKQPLTKVSSDDKEDEITADLTSDGSDSGSEESTDLASDGSDNDSSEKRRRLEWTPQLHKRFVDALVHLGVEKAVPETILQLMNVEGLTRGNIASHLQKYRLYLKRMHELPSSSDSTPIPIPQKLQESGGGN